MDKLEIRESEAADLRALESLYSDAFPDEDLLPLVRDLLQDAQVACSLVGIMGSSLIGHVIVTRCGISESEDKVALLGPLAVMPAFQKRGVGSALVRRGLEVQKHAGVTEVYVLGDPSYYRRFGFAPERDVETPYPLPAEWLEAWQSISLTDTRHPRRGKLTVPQPWRKPALWSG